MLENWNNGIMGLKEYYQFKNDDYRLYHPVFQYSIIPLFHVRVKNISLKNTFISNKL